MFSYIPPRAFPLIVSFRIAGFVLNPHIQDNRPVYENRNKYAKI